MKVLLFTLLGGLCVEANHEDSREFAKLLIKRWISALPFPESEEVRADLADLTLFNRASFSQYPHSVPPVIFTSQEHSNDLLVDIGGLLRRGINRFTRNIDLFLSTVEPGSLQFLVHKIRAVLNSYNDFYTQVKLSLALGPRQLLHLPEHAEYGPETNFWAKFRPYLACFHTPRLGPELGGFKQWCNQEWLNRHRPKFVLSGGSGGDFAFEDSLLEMFPGVKVVTLDCFMPNTTAYGDDGKLRDPDRLIYIPECLHGIKDDDLVLFRNAKGSASTFPDFAARIRKSKQIEYFDLHKMNIETFEYATYGHIMRDADTNLAGTKQIMLEIHRLGMADYGLNWNSLLLLKLLFATFYSGGFHPVAQEKWHDATSASDFVFVNQTWYLESELEAYEMTYDELFPLDRGTVDGVSRTFNWSVFGRSEGPLQRKAGNKLEL